MAKRVRLKKKTAKQGASILSRALGSRGITGMPESLATNPAAGGLRGMLGGAGLKGAGATLLAAMIAQRLMNLPSEFGGRGVQREAIRAQAEMATPENLYLQAALPQAQAEESMAQQALLGQLSGGVLGPALAKGERLIGG